MKTKIKTISPDQNIIEHESGLKTVFIPLNEKSRCINCCYCALEFGAFEFYCGEDDSLIQCGFDVRTDKQDGYFKLLEP